MSFCQPHLERKHVEILATRVAFGTPMCDDCFGSGEEVTPRMDYCDKRGAHIWKTIRPRLDCRPSKSKGSAENIVAIVSKAYGLRVWEVKGRATTCPISIARQVSMFIIRKHLGLSWVACGKLFGRHHSTALYAVDAVRVRIANNRRHRAEIEHLYKQATGQDL